MWTQYCSGLDLNYDLELSSLRWKEMCSLLDLFKTKFTSKDAYFSKCLLYVNRIDKESYWQNQKKKGEHWVIISEAFSKNF